MTERYQVDESDNPNYELLPKKFREVDQVYEPDFEKIDEDFVQKLWNAQRFFNANLISIDGRDVRAKTRCMESGRGTRFYARGDRN